MFSKQPSGAQGCPVSQGPLRVLTVDHGVFLLAGRHTLRWALAAVALRVGASSCDRRIGGLILSWVCRICGRGVYRRQPIDVSLFLSPSLSKVRKKNILG